jgi:hypothetical protein
MSDKKSGRIDMKDVYVHGETRENFEKTAREFMDDWYDVLTENVSDFDFGQIVTHKQEHWIGAFLWRRARNQSYQRDRLLDWSAFQQAERLPLVVECVGFQPRHFPDYGALALEAATGTLQQHWQDFFGYRPLLVDMHMQAGGGFPWHFQNAGWTRTTNKSPSVAASHWVKELVPHACGMLEARKLDKSVYAGAPAIEASGLLPIPDALLVSFRKAFEGMDDERENNLHYGLESIVSLVLLALFAGCSSVYAIAEFCNRLSSNQAQVLGLPYSKKKQAYDIPGYHVFYRMLPRTDYQLVAKLLFPWMEEHKKDLPAVLQLDRQLVRESLQTLVVLTSRKPIHRYNPAHTPITFSQDCTIGQIWKAKRQSAN